MELLTGKYQDTMLQSAAYRTATSRGNICTPIYSIEFSPPFFHAKNDDKFAKNTPFIPYDIQFIKKQQWGTWEQLFET
jgi:hypothetical protein